MQRVPPPQRSPPDQMSPRVLLQTPSHHHIRTANCYNKYYSTLRWRLNLQMQFFFFVVVQSTILDGS